MYFLQYKISFSAKFLYSTRTSENIIFRSNCARCVRIFTRGSVLPPEWHAIFTPVQVFYLTAARRINVPLSGFPATLFLLSRQRVIGSGGDTLQTNTTNWPNRVQSSWRPCKPSIPRQRLFLSAS